MRLNKWSTFCRSIALGICRVSSSQLCSILRGSRWGWLFVFSTRVINGFTLFNLLPLKKIIFDLQPNKHRKAGELRLTFCHAFLCVQGYKLIIVTPWESTQPVVLDIFDFHALKSPPLCRNKKVFSPKKSTLEKCVLSFLLCLWVFSTRTITKKDLLGQRESYFFERCLRCWGDCKSLGKSNKVLAKFSDSFFEGGETSNKACVFQIYI